MKNEKAYNPLIQEFSSDVRIEKDESAPLGPRQGGSMTW